MKELKYVNSADEELNALGEIETKDIAIIRPDVSGSYSKASREIKNSFVRDSTASIKLDEYKANHLKYTSNNNQDGFAVFSEIYYKDGWKATIDGKETEIYKVDYTLRGIAIPKGNHKIEFKFEPQVVKTGSTIALISSILMLLVVIGVVYFEQKGKKSE